VIVVTLNILLNHMQTISIVALAQIAWPEAVASFFSVATSSSTLSTQGIGLECTMGTSGKDPFVMLSLSIYVLLPAALLYSLLFWVLYDPAASMLRRIASSDGASSETEDGRLRVVCSTAELPRRMRTTVGTLSVAMLATVTSSAFRLLTCRTVAPVSTSSGEDVFADAQRRMVANLELSCDDPATRSLALGLALPPLILYSLGLPIALAVVLWRGVRPGSASWQLWSFATVGYRQETIWWEGWVMVRKFALIAVTVLLGTASPVVQLASAVLVSMAGMAMHAWQKPFVADTLNWLEMGAQVVGTMTVVTGLYVAASGQNAAGGAEATVAVIAANSAFLLAVVSMIGVSARSGLRGNGVVMVAMKKRRGSLQTTRPTISTALQSHTSFSDVTNPIAQAHGSWRSYPDNSPTTTPAP